VPAIKCENHGRQLATLVCPHVAERCNHQSSSTGIVAIRGTWIDPSYEMVLFWCCSECAFQYGFANEQQPIDYVGVAEDFERSLAPICSVCFEAWRKGNQADKCENDS
jgi:hypothetical protein